MMRETPLSKKGSHATEHPWGCG